VFNPPTGRGEVFNPGLHLIAAPTQKLGRRQLPLSPNSALIKVENFDP
jgi:hypothetical protein